MGKMIAEEKLAAGQRHIHMAHSLEFRVLFLDKEVFKVASQILHNIKHWQPIQK